MQLYLENIGKVNTAKVDINTITVIAGKNGTGKSTISQSLFSIFNSFYQYHNVIDLERRHSLESLFSYVRHGFFDKEFRLSDLIDDIVNVVDEQELVNIFESYTVKSEFYLEIISKIVEINKADEQIILNEIVNRIFSDTFNNHITNINNDLPGKILLTFHNEKNIELIIQNSEIVEFDSPLNLSTEIVYIDNPLDLNYEPMFLFASRRSRYFLRSKNRKQLLHLQYNRDVLDVIDKAILNEKLATVFNNIDAILGNDIKMFATTRKNSEDKLSLNSLSSGIKTFYLLRRLIENGTISENGTIILDEPEVHLHPEFQIRFAEIIILLQKELNLHILINTHSPYMVEALESYVEKYDVKEGKFYTIQLDNNESVLTDVTNDTSIIYADLAKPLFELEDSVNED